MARAKTRRLRARLRAALIVPLVLLWLVVVEEVLTHVVRQRFSDPHLRTTAVVVCYGVGFGLVSNLLGPFLKRLMYEGHRSSGREGGAPGVALFYTAAYGLLYAMFYVIETQGPAALLPSALR